MNTVSLSRAASRKRVTNVSVWKKTLIWGIFLTCVVLMLHVNTWAEKTVDFYVGMFTSITFAYFLLKMVVSFWYKPDIREPYPGIKVSVVIPSFNENPDSVLKTIECLIDQDYPVAEIIFVDDGSDDPSAYEAVKRLAEEVNGARLEAAAALEMGGARYHWAKDLPEIVVHRFDKNQGKRAAQLWGFKRSTGDFLMIVDSDGYIYPDAIRELLKPFHDPEVTAVCGHINARNRDYNFVTRLQDLLYKSAFRVGRAAMSVTNAVLVCSGALSMFRRDVVMNNLHHFRDQKFLGRKIVAGDDRRLTTIALYEGKVKYQSTARCITDVPTTISQFFKQQVRWGKSVYVETPFTIPVALKKPFLMLWFIGESFLWAIYGTSVIVTFTTAPTTTLPLLVIYSLGYLTLSALMRNVYYVLKHPLLYLLSPVFGLVHSFLLYPIRIYALLTLRGTGWGTR
ncbi:hyaluronan synthase [Polycladomyces abyssicola]|uniref:Hyaluronan synthase n=1 Tax=Polycladomyces abyssicola TaxID=1125966 RepID=A0A8D5UJB2_9BACL|nr:glycosyltransferase [Polycladomyces abyssicola]BCU82867.1 hyaluronan synthase [Polycladomyces abyssicola]